MNLTKIFQSKIFKIIILVLAGLIILLVGFSAGLVIGFKKANFSYSWGENYHKNFAGPRGGFFQDFGKGDFIEAYGNVGQIIKIGGLNTTSTPAAASSTLSIVIKGQNDVEKIILIKEDTAIKNLKQDLKPADLKVNDFIVVIGEPNSSGQIEAKLIRIMPAPNQMPPPPSQPMRWR